MPNFTPRYVSRFFHPFSLATQERAASGLDSTRRLSMCLCIWVYLCGTRLFFVREFIIPESRARACPCMCACFISRAISAHYGDLCRERVRQRGSEREGKGRKKNFAVYTYIVYSVQAARVPQSWFHKDLTCVATRIENV